MGIENIKASFKSIFTAKKNNEAQKDKPELSKKEKIARVAIASTALTAAAITGAVIVKKSIAKKLANEAKDTSIKLLTGPKRPLALPDKRDFNYQVKMIRDNCKEHIYHEEDIMLAKGISRHDMVVSTSLGGKQIFSTFSKKLPTGIKSMKTVTFVNGDIVSREYFDETGLLIKSNAYSRTYLRTKAGNIRQIEHYDINKGMTKKIFNYNHDGKLTSFVIKKPDGSKIYNQIKEPTAIDKVKNALSKKSRIGMQLKVMNVLNMDVKDIPTKLKNTFMPPRRSFQEYI